MNRVLGLGALAGVVVMVAACGGGGTTSGASPSATPGVAATSAATSAPTNVGPGTGSPVSDPCALIHQSEVGQILGAAVGPGTTLRDLRECDWQYPTGGVPDVQASITIEVGTCLADLCGEPSSAGLGITVTQLTGVGDDACFTAFDGLSSGDNLSFAKGGQVFTVASVPGRDASVGEIEATDKALALAALGHL